MQLPQPAPSTGWLHAWHQGHHWLAGALATPPGSLLTTPGIARSPLQVLHALLRCNWSVVLPRLLSVSLWACTL